MIFGTGQNDGQVVLSVARGRYRGLFRVEAEAALAEREPNPVPDDQVVEHVDIKQLAGLYDLVRHQYVLNIYMENHLTV